MARVTIEFVDKEGEKFAIIAKPSFEELGRRAKQGMGLTPAEINAVLVMKRIHEEFMLDKKYGKKNGLILPN